MPSDRRYSGNAFELMYNIPWYVVDIYNDYEGEELAKVVHKARSWLTVEDREKLTIVVQRYLGVEDALSS